MKGEVANAEPYNAGYQPCSLRSSPAWLVAVGCGGSDNGGGGGSASDTQVLKWGLGSEFQLDPGLATDTTSAKLVLNIFDPLVKLDDKLNAAPSMAESWDVNGAKVVYHLKSGSKWTDGTPVTAKDYEYSWKRAASPELASDYAYQLFGIKGAVEYNSCKSNCDALKDKMGVKATDDNTLEVTLTSPQPWFVQQSAHSVFLPVPQKTVEQFGAKWTRPENIVSNGPFKVEAAQPSASITLVKDPNWRDADTVKLERVEGKIIVDATTAVQSFEAGEVDVLDEQLPPAETPRLKDTPEYQLYPGLGTSYYGFNVKDNITDIHQRRAMSLAVDRQSIIDNITQANEKPADAFTPDGMPGRDEIVTTAPRGRRRAVTSPRPRKRWPWRRTRRRRSRSTRTRRRRTRKSQRRCRACGSRSGSRRRSRSSSGSSSSSSWDRRRPRPSTSTASGGSATSSTTSTSSSSGPATRGTTTRASATRSYDALVAKAKNTPDNTARYAIYKQLEEKLTGQDGALPFIPLWYITYPNLERRRSRTRSTSTCSTRST